MPFPDHCLRVIFSVLHVLSSFFFTGNASMNKSCTKVKGRQWQVAGLKQPKLQIDTNTKRKYGKQKGAAISLKVRSKNLFVSKKKSL